MPESVEAKARRKEYMKAYRAAHKEEEQEAHREWYEGDKVAILAKQKVYNETHAEQIKKTSVAWHTANRDVLLAKMLARYYEMLPGDVAARANYRDTHREEIHAYMRSYLQEHPEVDRNAHRRRRARLANAEGEFTVAEFVELCAVYDNRCTYCNMEARLVPDHMTPLCRGGSNSLENITPACNPCNSRKHAKTYDEFVATLDEENRTRLMIEDYVAEHPEVAQELLSRNE